MAAWNREKREATCPTCLDPAAMEDALDRGQAGASAAHEWRCRHERREQTIRSRHKHLCGLILALTDDPHSTRVWATGADGEQRLGRFLEPLRAEGIAVLHDRRIPGSRANIDHLAIAPTGVYVIDAKNFTGRVEQRDAGGWFSTDLRLYVGRRDRTHLVGGMAKQVEAVRVALTSSGEVIPVIPAIGFVAADWSLFACPLRFGRVHVLWPQALAKLLKADGPLSGEQVAALERQLALALPPARRAG